MCWPVFNGTGLWADRHFLKIEDSKRTVNGKKRNFFLALISLCRLSSIKTSNIDAGIVYMRQRDEYDD